jgi:hypothetical protein
MTKKKTHHFAGFAILFFTPSRQVRQVFFILFFAGFVPLRDIFLNTETPEKALSYTEKFILTAERL